MERTVDGPPRIWSTIPQAAEWLGLGVGLLRAEIAAHPELLPTTRMGRADMIFWLDLVCYSHVRPRLKNLENGEAEEKC